MTEQDDWTRFQNMMEDAKYRLVYDPHSGERYFVHSNRTVYCHDGRIVPLGDWSRLSDKVGEWRVWLEDGSTPSPF